MIIIGELINASRKAIGTAIEALAGRDNFCMNYLKGYRAGMLS